VQADQMGCDIITVDNGILTKLNLIGKDLLEFSRETVQMFYEDAQASGFNISINS
jgi:transaldolase